MTRTQKMVTGSVFIAFGLVLPMAFHFAGLSGEIFAPMHIPVLMAGLFLGGRTGVAVGVLTPVLSSVITGMPPVMPNLPRMIAELGVYGLASGYFYKNKKLSLFISLLAAMVLGRAAALAVYYLLFMFLDLKIPPLLYIGTATVTSIPGIAVQFFFVPFIVKKLETTFRRKPALG